MLTLTLRMASSQGLRVQPPGDEIVMLEVASLRRSRSEHLGCHVSVHSTMVQSANHTKSHFLVTVAQSRWFRPLPPNYSPQLSEAGRATIAIAFNRHAQDQVGDKNVRFQNSAETSL